jgi:hypothetical protein
MSQTLVKTAALGNTPILERYVQQNKEWQSFVCAKLVAPIERVLRDLYCAAKAASKKKGVEIESIFKIILARVMQWTDDECSKEFSDSPKEIDACIRMAVRAHAIVMALTISRQCKEIIKVPNSQTFFKRVLIDTASEHNIEVFGSQDFAVRKHLRSWIVDNIVRHLLALVPVSLFTEEDEAEADTCAAGIPPSPLIAELDFRKQVEVEKPYTDIPKGPEAGAQSCLESGKDGITAPHPSPASSPQEEKEPVQKCAGESAACVLPCIKEKEKKEKKEEEEEEEEEEEKTLQESQDDTV